MKSWIVALSAPALLAGCLGAEKPIETQMKALDDLGDLLGMRIESFKRPPKKLELNLFAWGNIYSSMLDYQEPGESANSRFEKLPIQIETTGDDSQITVRSLLWQRPDFHAHVDEMTVHFNDSEIVAIDLLNFTLAYDQPEHDSELKIRSLILKDGRMDAMDVSWRQKGEMLIHARDAQGTVDGNEALIQFSQVFQGCLGAANQYQVVFSKLNTFFDHYGQWTAQLSKVNTTQCKEL